MQKEDDYSVFVTFLNSGLHGANWPNKVYAITLCRLNGSLTRLHVDNTPGGPHAEDNMLSYLKEMIINKSLGSQKITLYVNYSPCHSCSDLIISFLQDVAITYGIYLKMEVAFPAFYKMRRPSCEEERHSHKLPDYQDHKSNLNGLKKLQQNGVTVRPMNGNDWMTVAIHLNQHHWFTYTDSGREREDAVFHKDFERVMNSGGDAAAMDSLVGMFNNVRLRRPFAPETEPDALDVNVHRYRPPAPMGMPPPRHPFWQRRF